MCCSMACLGTRLDIISVLTPLIQTINMSMTSCIQFLSWHMYLNLLESLEVARPRFQKFDSEYYIEGIKIAFPIPQLHNANFPHCMVLNKCVKIVVSSSRFYMPE
jgi:hypothetical protein